jgi:glycosyltransferase involved in cell wall biosynthesis
VDTEQLKPPVAQGRDFRLLPLRDAFADWAHVPSDLVFEGSDKSNPHVTIAIPTFRRPRLLIESVTSAISQNFDRPVEVIVVDNDPVSSDCEMLLAAIPALRGHNFRYYRNSENIGMFGNWNRCIELGRGMWHTLLNDDDLLDLDFCNHMFAAFAKEPLFDALICRKRTLDQRLGEQASSQEHGPGRHTGLKRAYLEGRFRGRAARPLPVSKFFFGSLVGNTVGMVARKDQLLAIGGYYPEDYPSADHYFMARFAMRYRFGEARHMLASIRIAENESARPEVIRGFLLRNQQLREGMAGVMVPRWWLRFSALTVARHRAILQSMFGGSVTDEEVRQDLGVAVAKDRKRLFYALCTCLGVL